MSGAAQGYIGRNPGDSQVTIARQQFTPTGVTTDFTFTSGYTAGYVDVYINGAKILVGRDYTATNGSTVGLTSAAQNGDIVEIVAYKAFNVSNVSESNGNFTVGGILTVDDNTTLSGQLEVTGVSTFAGAVENVVSAGIVTALGFSGNITGAAATFTGDVSIGGTLTYEDVTNIDSVGIVTARAGVNVSGGQLQVGVAYSVGNAGVCTAAGFVGPLTGAVTGNATGLTGTPNISAGTIAGSTGTFTGGLIVGSGITMGSAGVSTFSGTADIHLHDNVRLNIGDSSDLTLYHDGSTSKIVNTSGTLDIGVNNFVLQRQGLDETMLTAMANGAVTAYYDNAVKFNTTKFGTVTTGIATATNGFSGNIVGYAATMTGAISLTAGSSANVLLCTDNSRIGLGNDADLVLYYDGPNEIGYINQINGTPLNLQIGNSTKLEINKFGTVTTGIATATQGFNFLGSATYGIEARSTSTQSTDVNKALKVKNNSDTNTFSVSYKGEVFVGPYDGGFLGIGTDNPQTQLHITAAGPVLTHDATNGSSGLRINSQQYQTAGQLLRVQNAGITTFVIQRNGFTGINTNTVQRGPLHVHNNGTGDCQIHMTNDETGPTGNDGFTIFTGGNAGPNAGFVNRETGGDIQVYTHNGSSVGLRLTIEDEGNLVSTAEIHDSKGNVRSVPRLSKSSAYVLIASDAGKCITITTGGVTINPSVMSEGDVVTIINDSGSNQTITQGSSMTLYDTGDDGSTGNKTLKGRGMATVWFTSNNNAYITGNFD